MLATSDAAWERIRPLMQAADDAEFVKLRDYFRAGIPGTFDAGALGACERLYALLGAYRRRRAGGAEAGLRSGAVRPGQGMNMAAGDLAPEPTAASGWRRAGTRLGWTVLSLVLLVGVLAGRRRMLAASRLLPGPAEVAAALSRAAADGALFRNIAITLARVAASFFIAMVLGSAIGIALGRSPRLDAVFGPWVIVLLNLPALVVIILCYVWFGLTEVAAVTAVAVNKIPNVAVTMREGAARSPATSTRWRGCSASVAPAPSAMWCCRNSRRSSPPPPAPGSR